ncbi:MAG: bifunctional diaminohydroxyphosphoribosylaminopyrimidine deaminase/5-amino-6-(5-phosphoribosylamino)uracil reductase RibD [Chitinophagales bacterium]|nr:bifunctional diaminohydroxyphosphoribosylaminopyrimidine deaminase/5-amino-6-(5-phosphoribosylamino)uracil reductase RibD [Chitinophagales bacterium]
MRRCFELARLGAGSTLPNPMVGAVLVHEGRIIGEGWHRQYGGPHAEVNCVAAVAEKDRALIPQATLYCSLEPCFHVGKTPPCVELVLRERIPRVVIANTDPNPKVAGQSVQKLRAAGVEVITGVLEQEGYSLNRIFFTWITEKRPYIVLKWAQSRDGFIGRAGERVAISSPETQRFVHRLRSEIPAILVGSNTALTDNPRLDTRLFQMRNAECGMRNFPPSQGGPGRVQGGPGRVRIVLDFKQKLRPDMHLLDGSMPTWVLVNATSPPIPHSAPLPGPPCEGGKFRIPHSTFRIPPGDALWPALATLLYEHKYAALLIEGGARVLHDCIRLGFYDEIVQIINENTLGGGISAPILSPGLEAAAAPQQIAGDQIFRWVKKTR